MNNRLLEILKYKTGGRQTEFAALLGWTPQYLTKLLKGDNFGIRPVMSVLTTFPDINARWFMLGEGDMLEQPKYTDIRKAMLENMLKFLDIEKFMPVMSSEELREFEQVVAGNKKADFSPELLKKWSELLQIREDKINEKFNAAGGKSEKICKQTKAKK